MGDPFWRRARFSAAPRAAEATGRGSASLVPPSDTQPRSSRNDLFDADWTWKGAREEHSVRAYDPQPGEGSSLGAPIQLSLPTPGTITPPLQHQHQRPTIAGSQAHASPSFAIPNARAPRSRNDTIYNVNHLTIVPPPPPPPSRFRNSSTDERERFGPRSLETSSAVSAGHAVGGVGSPVSPVTPTISVPITPVTPERDITPPTSNEKRAGGSCFEASTRRENKGCTGSLAAPTRTPNSSTRTTLLRKTPTTTAVLPDLTTPVTPSPLSGLSTLSRSSSLTATAQSPSSALSNVVRRAGRLLLPDAHEDDRDGQCNAEDGYISPAVGDQQRDTSSVEAAVARVRVDIVSRQWLVGYGRYAKVYLGSYKSLPPAFPSPSSTATTAAREQQTSGWTLCAVKLFEGDADSLRMARKEDEMLGYLQCELPTSLHDDSGRVESNDAEKEKDDGREFIVPRIALVDDTNIESPPAATATATMSELSRAGSLCGAGAGRKTPDGDRGLASHRFEGSPRTTTTAVVRRMGKAGGWHSRSSSETTAVLHRPRGAQSMLAEYPAGILTGEPPSPPRRPILLLPFFANGSMGTFLKTQREAGMAVDEGLWMVWFEQGLRALRWCKRKGVLHNDIKPANFLVDDGMNLKLGDFGSALLIAPHSPPHDGIGLGTVPYSSPEIVDPAPDRTFSFPSDLFSFGVTMRQCMTGREPYEGLRAVEMMYHVRKGNYWEWHSRRRLAAGITDDVPCASRRLAGITDDVPCASPTASGTLQHPISPTTTIREQLKAGVRRAESLREPARSPPIVGTTPLHARGPGLARTPSSDTIVRQAATISHDDDDGARPDTRVMGAGVDKREEWLRGMVDPDPARRPTVEALLDEVLSMGRAGEGRL